MITESTETPVTPGKPAVQHPTRLWNKNYLLLWQGQFVSRIGNQLFEIALILWLIQLTGSAALMGLLLMVSSIPALALAPIGGVFADRFSRRQTIILCDTLAGLAMLALAGLAFLAPENKPVLIGALFATSILLAVTSSFFGPAIGAAIPDLVPSTRLASAYAMGQLSQQMSLFIGQGIGGVLFRIIGAPVLFVINGLSFLFSALSETFITIPQQIPERVIGWRTQLATFRADLIAGLRYISQRRGLRDLVAITTVSSFFTAPVLLLLPFYVHEHLRVPVDWYGFLLAAFGAGSLVGYLIISLLRGISGRSRMLAMIATMAIDGATYGALALTQSPLMAIGLAVISGMATAFATVNITSLVQLTTPAEMRGRVGSLLTTISGSITPIAFGVSGIVADLTQRNIPAIYLSCSGILVALVLVALARREIRIFLSYDIPAEDVAAERRSSS